MKAITSAIFITTLALSLSGLAAGYRPADEHQRPASGATTL